MKVEEIKNKILDYLSEYYYDDEVTPEMMEDIQEMYE